MLEFAKDYFDALVYVHIEDITNESNNLKLKFLKYIGGQNHMFCRHHTLPRITSHHDFKGLCSIIKDGMRCKKEASHC